MRIFSEPEVTTNRIFSSTTKRSTSNWTERQKVRTDVRFIFIAIYLNEHFLLIEQIMKDKALWNEAARTDSFSLTLDEFLAFRHPGKQTQLAH